MNEEISIIDNETKKEKIIKFFKKNKKKLIILLVILILIPFIFFSYQIYLDKKKEKISSKYNLAITKFENGNDLEVKKIMVEIINNKDKTYSPLALYFIIDNNIQVTNEEVNRYFDIIINDSNLDNEIKNLNIYKKGLFNSSFASENDLLLILNPIINSDSFWKPHALILMGEYFFYKNQNQKAKEFFNRVISIETANETLKTQAKKRLVNIGG